MSPNGVWCLDASGAPASEDGSQPEAEAAGTSM